MNFFRNFVCHYSWIHIRANVCVCLFSNDAQTNTPNIWSDECFPFHTIFIDAAHVP